MRKILNYIVTGIIWFFVAFWGLLGGFAMGFLLLLCLPICLIEWIYKSLVIKEKV
jgi:hypothetical protein